MKRIFFLPLLVALFFFGACESEAPTQMTSPEFVNSVGLDIIASPSEQQAGKSMSFHAHIWGTEFDRVEWGIVGQDTLIGFSEDITHTFREQGFYFVGARAFLDSVVVATDTTRVTITPPDNPKPISVTATAAVPVSRVPYTTSLDADVQGGVGLIDYTWRKPDGTILGTTESIYYEVSAVGQDTVWVFAQDEIGQWGNTFVVLTGESGGDNPDEPINWMVETDLLVRSNHRQDTQVVEINYNGEFHLWAKLRFDVSPRKDVRIWLTYSDGSVRYFPTIPDMVVERPAIVMVDFGHALIEDLQQITLYLTTDPSKSDGDKCDGTVRILELYGSNEVPVSGYNQLIAFDAKDRPVVLSN